MWNWFFLFLDFHFIDCFLQGIRFRLDKNMYIDRRRKTTVILYRYIDRYVCGGCEWKKERNSICCGFPFRKWNSISVSPHSSSNTLSLFFIIIMLVSCFFFCTQVYCFAGRGRSNLTFTSTSTLLVIFNNVDWMDYFYY